MSLIKRGWASIRKNAHAILAVCAFAVSICALYVSVVEIRNNQEFQRISVWPRLWVAKSATNKRFQIHVINQGLGPAIIRSVRVTIDGERFHTWSDMKEKLGLASDTPSSHSTLSTRVLENGRDVTIMEIWDDEGRAAFHKAFESGRMLIEVTYSSVYGECWISSSDMTTRQIDSCPEERNPGFL